MSSWGRVSGGGLRVFHWVGLPQGVGGLQGCEAGIWLSGSPYTLCPSHRFAPSLRQLKQQALLLHFPPTVPSRLVQRLQEVRGGGVGWGTEPRLPGSCGGGGPSPSFSSFSSCIQGPTPSCPCYYPCLPPRPQLSQVLRVRGDYHFGVWWWVVPSREHDQFIGCAAFVSCGMRATTHLFPGRMWP